MGEQVQVSPCPPEFSAPPSGSAQRQITFDSASSHVGSKELEDDDNADDSVTASAVDHSLCDYQNSFMINIPSLVLCPLLCFLQGVALSHILHLQTLLSPLVRIFGCIREYRKQ